MTETKTLPGEWETLFFDGRDEQGNHVGTIERRRLVAEVLCIGCNIHRTNPDMAMKRSYEVIVNGEHQGIEDDGCHCDQQEEAGSIPWRDTPAGQVKKIKMCGRCLGRGSFASKRVPGHRIGCSACQGTGWEE